MRSHSGIRTDLLPRSPANTLVTDFFGNVAQVQVTDDAQLSDGEEDEAQTEHVSDLLTPLPPQASVKLSSSWLRKERSNNQTEVTPVSTISLRAWGGLAALGVVVSVISRTSTVFTA